MLFYINGLDKRIVLLLLWVPAFASNVDAARNVPISLGLGPQWGQQSDTASLNMGGVIVLDYAFKIGQSE
jgi:hypothetical protein